MFRGYNKWRKMSSLRDTLISGFEPQVSNRSFGAIFDHANPLFQKMKNCLLLKLRSCGRFRNLAEYKWRKMSSLRDTLISGFEPQVLNRSFGAIFDHANRLFKR